MLGAIVVQKSDEKEERISEKAGDEYVTWHTSVPNRCVSWHTFYLVLYVLYILAAEGYQLLLYKERSRGPAVRHICHTAVCHSSLLQRRSARRM